MASPAHAINTGNVSPRRIQGASKLPVASGPGASASPGKMGETYTSFQPSTGTETTQKSRMSRIPTATTPKYSSTVPNSSPASRGPRGPATSRLSTITAKSAESFRFPSRLGIHCALSKNSGKDITSEEASEYSDTAPHETGMDSASRSEKPLPRPPSGARYIQRPTFISHFSGAKGDTSEDLESEGPELNEGWSVDSLPTSLHQEPKSGEELECSSTLLRVNETGVPSATPNTIVRRSTIKTIDFDRGPRSSIKTEFTPTLESPLRTVHNSIPYPETMRKETSKSVRKSYNPNSAMSLEMKSEKADHILTDNSQNVTPRARPKKPNPFRERLQSASPGTAPGTPLATTFSYDVNEGDIDQSPTPTYFASRKTGIPVPSSPSKEDGKAEPPPRTAKRKSKIPRILSPKVPLNGGASEENAEALQKSQETASANATAIPLPIRSSNDNNTGNITADIPPEVKGSKEAEVLSTSHAGSEVTDTTEIEIGEARAVATTKVSKGGFQLKQLSIAGRSDGPTLRIDPDAERIIMGKGEADKGKKVSKRRSGAMRNIRRSTDSLLSSYISSKRSRKSSTDNAAEVSEQLEAQSQPRSFLPVKNLDIVKESTTPGRRTDSHKMSIRTVSETPKENVSPCSNKNGPRPSAGIESPNGNMNTQYGSPYGGSKKGEPSSRRRETHTLNDRINVNTPAKYTSPIPATPGERAAKEQVQTSGTRGQIPIRQANHASPRTPRREPNERMTFEKMGFTNAPSAATPYASNPPLRTVRSETRTMPPMDHSTATTRKSRIPSGIPKTKTRGVFQGFRGLFTKNKSNASKAAPDIAIGNVNAFASGRGTIGSSPVLSSSPSQRPKPGVTGVLSAVQSPKNLRVPNLHMTQSGPRIDDSPAMQDMSSITNLTMEVLAVARRESEVSKKQKLIAMGQILIATAAACHEAEAAMLRTLQGFKDAEVACAKAKENALKMAQIVRELTSEELSQPSH